MSKKVGNTERIRQLEEELAGVRAAYRAFTGRHMKNGLVVLPDEAAERNARELQESLRNINNELRELRFGQLSDEEKKIRRLNAIAFTEKFADEVLNQQRLEYMKLYLDLLERTKQLMDAGPEDSHEYRELYDHLDRLEFRYSLAEKFDIFCSSDPSLGELYLRMKQTFKAPQ